jgi:phosphonate transport system substrate-binding protein
MSLRFASCRALEQKIPGTRFQVEASRDYADYEAKIAGRRFHFGLPNPFQTVYSLEHGYHVIAKMTPDEDFRGLIVARADKKIQSPRDLAGKKLCFPPATAVAGTMLPMLWLHEQGLNIKEFQPAYVDSQFSSSSMPSPAITLPASHWARDNPDKAKELVVLWRTDSLPHNAVIARDDVPPALAQKVAAALIGMDKDPELDQSRFKADQAHFEPAAAACGMSRVCRA